MNNPKYEQLLEYFHGFAAQKAMLHAINAVAESYEFTEEDIRSYIEPADLTELASCDHAATLQRIAQLRELSPKHK